MLFNKEDLKARYLKVLRESDGGKVESGIINESFSFDEAITYDVFLSNKYIDKDVVSGLVAVLRDDFNLRVYVDWEEGLDRSKVDKATAALIRSRLQACKSLWYVASMNSGDSRWMPWEAGYKDGQNGRVAICPVVESHADDVYEGKEYLSLYPYVSRAKTSKGVDTLWINESPTKYVSFRSWLKGGVPELHL